VLLASFILAVEDDEDFQKLNLENKFIQPLTN
jgi:hypothetical protein